MPKEILWRSWLLVVGHGLNWLPYMWVERVAFLYHYIPALLLTVLATAIVLDALTQPVARVRVCPGLNARGLLVLLLLLVIILSSAYFMPLFMGWPLSETASRQRIPHLDPWGSSE